MEKEFLEFIEEADKPMKDANALALVGKSIILLDKVVKNDIPDGLLDKLPQEARKVMVCGLIANVLLQVSKDMPGVKVPPELVELAGGGMIPSPFKQKTGNA